MGQRTLEPEYRPPLRHDAPNLSFKDLLVEAYREREVLLRGSVATSAGPQDAIDVAPVDQFVAASTFGQHVTNVIAQGAAKPSVERHAEPHLASRLYLQRDQILERLAKQPLGGATAP